MKAIIGLILIGVGSFGLGSSLRLPEILALDAFVVGWILWIKGWKLC